MPLADPRGRQGRPREPNSFIFMQFLAKKLKNNSTFWSWRIPLGKILDPPLHASRCFVSLSNLHNGIRISMDLLRLTKNNTVSCIHITQLKITNRDFV